MLKNYLKSAWRNFVKYRGQSLINLTGLALGIAVTLIIALWIYDEVSYNWNFPNYGRIAQVMQHQTFDGEIGTQQSMPYLIGDELKKEYGADFKNVTMASWTDGHILSYGDKVIEKTGNFFEPSVINMLSLKLVSGNRDALNGYHSLLLSVSTARALFGGADPMGKTVKIDDKYNVSVTGIYSDFPGNCEFSDVTFIAPWKLFIDHTDWLEKSTNPWRNNSFQAYVQLADHVDIDRVSASIRDIKLKKISAEDAQHKPAVFLQPMRKWHLYAAFHNGVNTGGKIEYVWLFGIIGFFVLLLACINFVNLSTARSALRAREVGIRKSVGSMRSQLVGQFLFESLLVTFLALALSLVLVVLSLPYFNDIATKQMSIPWSRPGFWAALIGFAAITGLVAGIYPAFYLSSFRPVRVLRGAMRSGRFASIPRKVLVVIQFTASVILIIGTLVVFRQVQYAKGRPVGYTREGLITVPVVTEEIHQHFEAIRTELKNDGVIRDMAESSSPTTALYEFDGGFQWKGSVTKGDFGLVYVSGDFGKTVGWHITAGRDFSPDFPSDSSAFIVNQAAVKFMNLKNPVGEIIREDGKPFHIIGVVDDMVMESPYRPATRTIFTLSHNPEEVVNIRIDPARSTQDALAQIGEVFKKYNPGQPFDYHFTDEAYARKFSDEEQTGQLAAIFAALAVCISCLGLFGLASFVVERRTKEIGIRKVLGASVFGLWRLLSTEFFLLVMTAFLVAAPVASFLMTRWLEHYEYRTNVSWWILASAGLIALLITLATVSVQSIRAAMANPSRSLRTD